MNMIILRVSALLFQVWGPGANANESLPSLLLDCVPLTVHLARLLFTQAPKDGSNGRKFGTRRRRRREWGEWGRKFW